MILPSVLFMQFQKQAMFEFCKQHPEGMPVDELRQYELLRHLLYDDEKEVIFCYVPKGELSLSSLFIVDTVKVNYDSITLQLDNSSCSVLYSDGPNEMLCYCTCHKLLPKIRGILVKSIVLFHKWPHSYLQNIHTQFTGHLCPICRKHLQSIM